MENFVDDNLAEARRYKISLIMPLYNSEKFIKATLQSVLAQTFVDYELIIVDDCSTDSSVEIVKDVAEKFDGRLKLIECTQNSGGRPGIPRNVGIRAATGEYIYFLDSDDFLTPTALEELYSIAAPRQADVLRADKHYNYKPRVEFQKLSVLSCPNAVKSIRAEPTDIIERLKRFTSGKFKGHPPWKHFVRRQFLVDNGITFPNVRIFEDNYFAFYLFASAKIFLLVPNIVYVYRYRKNSISHQKHSIDDQLSDYIGDVSVALEEVNAFMDKSDAFIQNPDWKVRIFNYILRRRRLRTTAMAQMSDLEIYQRYDAFREKLLQMPVDRQARLGAYYFGIATVMQNEITRLKLELKALKAVVSEHESEG